MWYGKRPVRSKSVGPALAVLFLVNVLNFYDRQTLAAILEPLRHEFSLSDTQLGGLFTLFTVVFALAGLPLGKLADTRSRRRLLAAGIAVWTGLTGVAGLATSYAVLLATWLGVGIGEAACTPLRQSPRPAASRAAQRSSWPAPPRRSTRSRPRCQRPAAGAGCAYRPVSRGAIRPARTRP